MKRKFLVLGMVLATGLAAGTGNAQAGELHRLAANFLAFGYEVNTTETATSICETSGRNSPECQPGSPDGALFYDRKVQVPKGHNTVFVTFHATADVHNDAALWLSCRLNGEFCNAGDSSAAPGWVSLQKFPFDEHDNSVSYSWCVKVDSERQDRDVRVALKLASSQEGSDVYFENAHIYVDSARLSGKDRCKELDIPDAPVGTKKAEKVRRHHGNTPTP